MKKKAKKKMALSKETIRNLTPRELARVAGGGNTTYTGGQSRDGVCDTDTCPR